MKPRILLGLLICSCSLMGGRMAFAAPIGFADQIDGIVKGKTCIFFTAQRSPCNNSGLGLLPSTEEIPGDGNAATFSLTVAEVIASATNSFFIDIDSSWGGRDQIMTNFSISLGDSILWEFSGEKVIDRQNGNGTGRGDFRMGDTLGSTPFDISSLFADDILTFSLTMLTANDGGDYWYLSGGGGTNTCGGSDDSCPPREPPNEIPEPGTLALLGLGLLGLGFSRRRRV